MAMEDNLQEQAPKKFVGKYDMDLEYGIESILPSEQPKHLPKRPTFDPVDGKIENRLKNVISVKTLIGSMINLLRPEVTDRSILTPQQFRLKLQQIIEVVNNESQSKPTANKSVLEEVIKLIANEQEKSELLDEYRHMLLLG